MKARSLAILLLSTLALSLRADEVDDLVRANMEEGHITGLALGICIDGELVERRVYGLANLETRTTVKPETVFKIASMSKAFCSTAVMMLVEEGKLSLEDKVSDLLPNTPAAWSEIRLKHLLSHTSGIPDVPDFSFTRQYTRDEFLALYADLKLQEEPGSTYRYNNFGYATLGLIVGEVTGKPLREFVTERILQPLGMNATHYYDMAKIVPNRAYGYDWTANGQVNVNPVRPYVYDGSGGLLTNLLDYAQWDKALRNDTLIKRETKEMMFTKFTLNDGTAGTYGFGWMPGSFDGERVVSHSGGTLGFTSYYLRGLESGVSVFVFRNGNTGRPSDLARSVFTIIKKRRGR